MKTINIDSEGRIINDLSTVTLSKEDSSSILNLIKGRLGKC